jgi:GntR family transcriptional regulator
VIELDRDAALPIAEQLVEQLRYHLAAGRYRTGERLPSTRTLAEQLGISFHTDRKAYQRLETEGLLEGKVGGGFYVAERPTLSAAERRERGASVVQEALQKLVALGLSEDETEYLFEEQRQFFESPGVRRKLLCAAPFRERAESLAEQLTGALQERVEPVALSEVGRHADADVVFAPFPSLASVLQAVPKAEPVGLLFTLSHDVLARVARLGPHDTLGLVTKSSDAVGPLTDEVRTATGFNGQVLALTIEGERRRLETLVRQAGLIAYTPQVRRRLRPLLGEAPHVELVPVVAPDTLAHVREVAGR